MGHARGGGDRARLNWQIQNEQCSKEIKLGGGGARLIEGRILSTQSASSTVEPESCKKNKSWKERLPLQRTILSLIK